MRAVSFVILGVAIGLLIATAWAAMPHNPGSHYFSDVSPSSPHNQDIGYLVEYGVTQGTDATHYSPAYPVTREQMASYLMRQTTADTLMSWILVDDTYFAGEVFGWTAYQEGRISYADYQLTQDLLGWWLEMIQHQAGVMGPPPSDATGPALLAAQSALGIDTR